MSVDGLFQELSLSDLGCTFYWLEVVPTFIGWDAGEYGLTYWYNVLCLIEWGWYL